MGMIENLMGALFANKLTGMAKKEKGSVGEGFKYLIVAGVIVLLLGMLRILLQGVMGGSAVAGAAVDVMFFVLGVVSLVITLIVTYIVVWLFHWIATSMLKGKADFGQVFFCFAVLWSAVQLLTNIVSFVFGFLGTIGVQVVKSAKS